MKSCQCCQIFEGAIVKASLYPIKAFVPLELVHIDFTSIETTTKHKDVLVITDHFTRYSMAFVTKDQKAKLSREYYMNDSTLACLLSC